MSTSIQFHNPPRPSLKTLVESTGLDFTGWDFDEAVHETEGYPILDIHPPQEGEFWERRHKTKERYEELIGYGFSAIEVLTTPNKDRKPFIRTWELRTPAEKIRRGEADDGTIIAAGPLMEGTLWEDMPYRVVLRVVDKDPETGRIKKLNLVRQYIPPGCGKNRNPYYGNSQCFTMPENPNMYAFTYVTALQEFHKRIVDAFVL